MDQIEGMRAFVATVETGSFTRAGQRLGLSNKLVSKYVAALEDRTGVSLLYRTTRALSLTEAGSAYLTACRKVLAALEEADAALHPAEQGFTGNLRITAPLTFGEIFVVDAVREFLRANPAVQIDLSLNDGLADLAREGFDLAVRIGNLADSGLIARRLGESRMVLVASPAYLDRHGTPARPEDLAHHCCVLDSNNPIPGRWAFLQGDTRLLVNVHGRFSVNNATAAIRAALDGEGIVSTLDIFAAPYLRGGRLLPVLPDENAGRRDIQAVYLRTTFRQPKIAGFVDFLRDRFHAPLG